MEEMGGDFSERGEDKLTFVKEGVRNLEVIRMNLFSIIEEEIKVDRPGAPSKGLAPSQVRLNGFKRSEESMSRQVRLNLDDAIDKPILVRAAHGLCSVIGGLSEEFVTVDF
jgi:hypothetical protein